MRIIVQRVNRAKVTSEGKVTGEIQKGLMLLVGLGRQDSGKHELIEKWAKKILKLRLWPEILEQPQENGMEVVGEDGKPVPPKVGRAWRSNLMDNNYGVLVVSQFTLYGKLKGNRPDFHNALGTQEALELYNYFVDVMKKEYNPEKVQIGNFGKMMAIDMEGDGPVTLTLEEDAPTE